MEPGITMRESQALLPSPALIECREFSFFYGKTQILDKISFTLERGGWLSVIGANGSGKSTLLKNMMRLPAGRRMGELRIADHPIEQYSQRELARIMAYVPQAGGRIPPFTVREFLSLSRYPYGMRADDIRKSVSESVDRAIFLTGIENFTTKRLDQLSGGQRQRAYLAAALTQEAEILLLDEPSSFLDPKHVFEMNELLKNLHTQAAYTIMVVTHDLNQPLEAGGNVLVLRKGQQIHFGPVDDLLGNGILEKAFEHTFSYLTHPKNGKPLVIA